MCSRWNCGHCKHCELDTYHDTAQVLENLEKHTKICIIKSIFLRHKIIGEFAFHICLEWGPRQTTWLLGKTQPWLYIHFQTLPSLNVLEDNIMIKTLGASNILEGGYKRRTWLARRSEFLLQLVCIEDCFW